MIRIFMIAAFFIVLAAPSFAASCADLVKTPWSVVSLMPERLQVKLANKQDVPKETQHISLHEQPAGKKIGAMDVTYDPLRGLSATLIRSGKAVDFTPPIYDGDVFYGPWFHVTLLEERGEWKKIVVPGMTGWAQLPGAEVLRFPREDEAVDVYTVDGKRNVVILSANPSSLVVRDEQQADMSCGQEGETLQPFKEYTLSLDELYDQQCNLLLRPAYLRGC